MRSERANKDEVFLSIAQELSMLGTCDRAYVGAVITRHGRCVSWGYNGAPPGLPHCSENLHGLGGPVLNVEECGCDIDRTCTAHRTQASELRKHGCRNATHAEANALANAARFGISTDGGTLYVTVSPCETCARLLIAAGISRVVYATRYRDTSGEALLNVAGVEVHSV